MKTEFKKIRQKIDIDSSETMKIEEKIKDLWYKLQKGWDIEIWKYLIDIAHYSRFIRHNPDIQANLVQYSYWKNILNKWEKSY
jgi:hypothetical protein